MRKSRVFWPLLLALVLADCGTKRIAEDALVLHSPREVAGDVLRFTLTYNTGAAFGINVGDASRPVFIGLALVALVALGLMYRAVPAERRLEAAALALIAGGAIGNLLDRLRGPGGVVDFIDVGIGPTRFWTFNLADAGITVGAVLLATILWKEPGRAMEEAPDPAGGVETGGEKGDGGTTG
jgi:signal peptidase II